MIRARIRFGIGNALRSSEAVLEGATMGALQTSLKSKTTATAVELVRATLRRSQSTRSVSQPGKPQIFGGKPASPAARKEWYLLQQAIAGNSDAQEQLFKTHTPRVFRTAFAVLRNKEDAEDAVQDSWCTAYRNLGSFQGRSAFSTWLTRIAINSALMRRRRKKVRTEASLDEILDNHSESILERAVDKRPNPEQACLAIEVKALLEGQIRELPPGTREAFRLREVEGFSTTETLEALGIHNSALKSRISRARQRLAGALKQSILRPARIQAGSQRVRIRKQLVSFQRLTKNVPTVLDQQAQMP
jgi:RNA polymerase sigma-70 factor, ECF subfamily